MNTHYRYTLTVLLLLCVFQTNLNAQESPAPPRPAIDSHREIVRLDAKEAKNLPPEIEGQYTKMTISATREFPEPLLKYRLSFYPNEKQSGNAAFLYAEAFSEHERIYSECMNELYRTKEYREVDPKTDSLKIEALKFKAFPLYPAFKPVHHQAISVEEEERFFSKTRNLYDILERASRRSEYDWSDTYEFRGWMTMMPHLDKSRTLGRYLAGKADWEIRCGKYEDAIKTLRVGITLAENVRDKNSKCSLIGTYVGNAIYRMIFEQIEHLSAQADAPNLYPALTQITLHDDALINAMNMEKYALFNAPVPWDVFDTINEASEKEVQDVLNMLLRGFVDYNSSIREPYKNSAISMMNTFASISVYPQAKQRLLDRGLTEEDIEKMSTTLIVGPYIVEEIKRDYDDMMVRLTFPRGEAHSAIRFDASRNPHGGNYRDALDIYRALYLPATEGAYVNHLGVRQKRDLLMIINALRCYAAKHGNSLPNSLEEIREVPVPKIDPVTGEAYKYRRQDNTATLDYMGHRLSRLEITLE